MRVHAHRAGAVQREHGHDVVEPGGLHAPQQVPHGPAVELEHPEGVALAQQLVGGLVLQRQRVQVELGAPVAADVVDGVADDGEVAQAEEVHLEQTDGLAVGVGPAGDEGTVLRPLPHRDGRHERLGGHDHRAGVHACVADQPLEPARRLVDLRDVGIGLDERTDLGGFLVALVGRVGDAPQRDVLGHDRWRQGLGDAVGHGEAGLAEGDARGVLDRGLGLDGAEGDDLGDLVRTPALGRVAHHLPAPAVVEVDVDVRVRRALGVEEALEEQPVRDRVDVGDAEGVRDQRAGGRTTAGTDPDAHLPGVGDEVGDDEEVGGETLVPDDAQLEVHAGVVTLRHPAGEAPPEPGEHLAAQELVLGLPGRDREDGHAVALGPHLTVGLHPLGDGEGVVAGAGHVLPERAHLLRRLQVVPVAVELEARGVGQGLAGLDAEQHLVVLGGILGDVVAVVGGQRRDAERAAHLQQALADPALDGQPVVHQLEVEVLLAEDVLPARGGLQCLPVLTQPKARLHLAGGASGGGDDARGMLGDDLGIHPRPLAQLALDGSPAGEREQVAQPGGVLREHGHVGVGAGAGHIVGLLARVAPQHPLGAQPRLGRHVSLDADDRGDAVLGGLRVELAGPVHVAVVGHPDRRHPQPLGLVEQRADLGRAVEHRVLRVGVQVHERASHANPLSAVL